MRGQAAHPMSKNSSGLTPPGPTRDKRRRGCPLPKPSPSPSLPSGSHSQGLSNTITSTLELKTPSYTARTVNPESLPLGSNGSGAPPRLAVASKSKPGRVFPSECNTTRGAQQSWRLRAEDSLTGAVLPEPLPRGLLLLPIPRLTVRGPPPSRDSLLFLPRLAHALPACSPRQPLPKHSPPGHHPGPMLPSSSQHGPHLFHQVSPAAGPLDHNKQSSPQCHLCLLPSAWRTTTPPPPGLCKP